MDVHPTKIVHSLHPKDLVIFLWYRLWRSYIPTSYLQSCWTNIFMFPANRQCNPHFQTPPPSFSTLPFKQQYVGINSFNSQHFFCLAIYVYWTTFRWISVNQTGNKNHPNIPTMDPNGQRQALFCERKEMQNSPTNELSLKAISNWGSSC